MRVADVADRATAYGMPGRVIDGNDPDAAFEAIAAAVDRARAGDGPTLIEAKTYRLRGHYEGDPQHYREQEEIDEWSARDPVVTFRSRLLDAATATAAELDALEAEVADEVAGALAAALEAPVPTAGDILGGVYANESEAL